MWIAALVILALAGAVVGTWLFIRNNPKKVNRVNSAINALKK